MSPLYPSREPLPPAVFEPGERAAIDARLDEVRSLLTDAGMDKGAAHPFSVFRRWAKSAVRRGAPRGLWVRGDETSSLLILWARHHRDVLLYVDRPLAALLEVAPPSANVPPALGLAAARACALTPSFEDFARTRLMSGAHTA